MTRRKPAPVDYVRRPPVGSKTGAESIGYTPPLDPDLAAAARRECHRLGADDLLAMLGLDQEATT